MTLERRCHWCGQPSAPDYADACDIHKEKARAITKISKVRSIQKREREGICIDCGKKEARYGYTMCTICGKRNAEKNRCRREGISVVVYDHIIDKDLVSVSQSARMIGVHRTRVHRLIKLGVLKVSVTLMGRFWLKEYEVNFYIKHRTAKMLNIVKCEKCGYEWWLRKSNGHKPRCPIVGCHSSKVVHYKSSKALAS